jgi:hypothetical protein
MRILNSNTWLHNNVMMVFICLRLRMFTIEITDLAIVREDVESGRKTK